ncbi:type II toxin-antitoxin system HipA family toxin [Glaciihabitans sp. UYNi722]|uniref:type II toxin-antitoxin system HipA family toxin n=1 Tax=Glaciihabitans sp. UYNi722 TaxID=3156344 RepID=UPI00339AC4EB
MYYPVDAVEVLAWGERVGAIALDPALGYYVFEYYPEWKRKEIELAPLHAPLSGSSFVFPSLPESTYYRLPPFIADSLPDDFGNALIDAYLAQQGLRRADVTALDRLAYMASRAMGALEFRPSRGPRHRRSSAVELADLVEGARSVLGGTFAGDRETEAALQSLIQVGTSAGGARAKAVIAWNRETNEIRSGQLPADPGFEYWLIKLDGIGADTELGSGGLYGRIEYAYYLMAGAAGITMTECRLLEENGRAHFMTRRFDRVTGRDSAAHKVHTLTLCGIAHLDFRQRGTHDYSQYFQVIDELGMGPGAREEAFRRMVFNVLARNCDDHTKNFSFVLDPSDGAEWQLSPAYDITFAYNPNGEWTYQHLMSVNGRFAGITRDDMLAVADRFQVPRARAVIREVVAAVGQWTEFAQQAGVEPAQATEIGAVYPDLE